MPKQQKRKSKHIFLFIRICVVGLLILLMVYRVSREQRWSSFVEYFRRMNPLVFALALGIFTFGSAVIGLRWWLLLRAQSIFISPLAAVKLYFLGWFYNIFMPGSVGGDLIRAGYVTKHTDKKFEAALSVFFDRLIGLLSTLAIAAFVYVLFLWRGGQRIIFSGRNNFVGFFEQYRWVFLWLVMVSAAIFVLLCLLRPSRAVLKKGWVYFKTVGLKMLRKTRDSIFIYCTSPLKIFAAFVLTIFVQILIITGFWVLGSNMGIEVEIGYYFVFFTLTWVIGAIPVSIGGAGVVEGSLVFLFTQVAGVEEPAAWAIALSQRAIWLIASLPGAVIHLLGAHLPKDFFIDYDNPIE